LFTILQHLYIFHSYDGEWVIIMYTRVSFTKRNWQFRLLCLLVQHVSCVLCRESIAILHVCVCVFWGVKLPPPSCQIWNNMKDTRESLKMKQEACWYLVMTLLDVCVCVIWNTHEYFHFIWNGMTFSWKKITSAPTHS